MAETLIRAIPNGPYRVNGPAKIVDPAGNEIAIEEGRAVSLCRCGGSANKPFCDSTHSRIGFVALMPMLGRTWAGRLAACPGRFVPRPGGLQSPPDLI